MKVKTDKDGYEVKSININVYIYIYIYIDR